MRRMILFIGEPAGRFLPWLLPSCCSYLRLYVFCEGYVLGVKLRVTNLDGSRRSGPGSWSGSWDNGGGSGRRSALPRCEQISSRARESLMEWCEEPRVDYVFELASNQSIRSPPWSRNWNRPTRFNNRAACCAQSLYRTFVTRHGRRWTQERLVLNKLASYRG